MEKTTRKIREYGLKDFIKVLRGNWLTLLLCVLLTAAVLGGSLGCVSAFIRHNEYSATIAKVDTATFDVPVVRASLRDHIEVILKEKYPYNGLSDKDFNDLSNAVNAHLSLSENPEGTFAFTLSSFDAKQVHMSQDDFKDILNRIIDWYKESYTDKIVTSYLIKASAIGESTKKLTYYLQIRTLENTIDSLIGEVRIVAGMEQMPGIDISDTTISSSTTVDRSEFAAYYCEENGKRVNDILTDLENLDAAVAAARDEFFLAVGINVAEDASRFRVAHEGAEGQTDDDVFPARDRQRNRLFVQFSPHALVHLNEGIRARFEHDSPVRTFVDPGTFEKGKLFAEYDVCLFIV